LPSGEPGALSTTKFKLPPLKPPTDDLVALLNLPSTGKLHVPMMMKLTVRNGDPSRTAVVTVHLEPDPSDGFVVAGLRSGRLPMLLPETETTIDWKLIPVECGFVKVPKMKVIDRRKAIIPPGQEPLDPQPEPGSDAEGDILKLVDVRWGGRTGSGEEARAAGNIASVLIIP
jgi:trafficking protein particle complex subunit 11